MRHQLIQLERRVDVIASVLPDGWRVRLAGTYSEERLCVTFALSLSEWRMGWSAVLCSDDPETLLSMAVGYVDGCMAATLPDQGYGPDRSNCAECSATSYDNDDGAHFGECSQYRIPKPSKCHVTQGEDKREWLHTSDGSKWMTCDGGPQGQCMRPQCPCHTKDGSGPHSVECFCPPCLAERVARQKEWRRERLTQ